MNSSSSRTAFLFVVRKAQTFFRRVGRLVTTFLGDLCMAALRVVVTCVVFTMCVMVLLHYLGVPVPGPSDLLDTFDGVGRLADILS